MLKDCLFIILVAFVLCIDIIYRKSFNKDEIKSISEMIHTKGIIFTILLEIYLIIRLLNKIFQD